MMRTTPQLAPRSPAYHSMQTEILLATTYLIFFGHSIDGGSSVALKLELMTHRPRLIFRWLPQIVLVVHRSIVVDVMPTPTLKQLRTFLTHGTPRTGRRFCGTQFHKHVISPPSGEHLFDYQREPEV
ncbi:hypothetical protein TNCV_4957011 [Trichonephila clavipes]|nr:hypothetical protein TNCV_4957011 [Trichonephila clavipes]